MRTPPPWTVWIIAAIMATAATGPAAAQLLGGGLGSGLGGGLGGLAPPLPPVSDLPEPRQGRTHAAPHAAVSALPQVLDAAAVAALTEARRRAAEALIRDHREAVEADEQGDPVVRGEVLALAPTAEALAAANRAGFRIAARTTEPALGLELTTLTAPAGVSAREAVRRLRALDPQGRYDYDHLYLESGGLGRSLPAADAAPPRPAAARPSRRRGRLGLVDGSVAGGHPALRGVALTQAAFAAGGARVTAHATAVASLLVGADGGFRGADPGAGLLVADVYGPTPAGGSAAAIVRGLGWLARNGASVINISLVGPPNLALEAAVRSLVTRGALLVAAVGNDGPAAPPLYPAAYPGVIAVTAVDARRRVLPEAGRGAFVSFAAPGAQMAAAAADGGFVEVRGTSFAAPLVAGELARDLPAPDPAAARRALARLAAGAIDLGAPGRDPVYGLGLVAFELRTDPARVGVRALALDAP